MASAFTSIAAEAFDRVAAVLDVPFARAVVLGVHIDGHLVVDAILLAVIVFLLLQKSYKPPKKPLTEKEIDQLCEEWVPEPLYPPITEEMGYEPPILESAAGPHTIVIGKETVNFASANYLGLIGNEKVMVSCKDALENYGVGSCGPRGFYGTIDTHLDCEARIAKFLGTPDSILYSYGISAAFSAIPAFCKKGDIVIVDEGVHWAIQNGLYLSRSTIKFFKHNDMKSLESLMEKITKENQRVKKLRRYIVIEAIYQRLSSSGYVFSASLPPYLASAAITAINILVENPMLLSRLRHNISLLYKGLSDIRGLVITSHPLSPIVFLKLKNSTGSFKGDLQLLEDIAERVLREDCVLLAVSKRSALDRCLLPAGIRLFVSSAHSETDLLKASESLKRVAKSVFPYDLGCEL